MKVVLQRSKNSKVSIDNKLVGQINKGLVLLVGFTDGDTLEDIEKVVNKVINLRIFEDESGLMNLSLLDVKGEILSISQFTLYADIKKGRRPSFVNALNPIEAEKLYDKFNKTLEEKNIKIQKGIFGADMKVEIYNDGPVTILVDSKEL